MSLFLLSTLLSASLAYGQVTFNSNNSTFSCAKATGAYCAGNSLGSPIIIRCSNYVGQPGNCNDNLAGVPPIGVKSFAPCYQSSPIAGDAACSYNGVAYPDNGSQPFNITSSSNTSSSSSTIATTMTTSSYSAGSIATATLTSTITYCSASVCTASTSTIPYTSVSTPTPGPITPTTIGTSTTGTTSSSTASHPAVYTPGNSASAPTISWTWGLAGLALAAFF